MRRDGAGWGSAMADIKKGRRLLAPPPFTPAGLAGDFLDALDHLVDGLLRRPLVGDHAVHRLRPDVLVVEDGELPVLGELEGHRAGRELVVHDLAVRVAGPELGRGARLR